MSFLEAATKELYEMANALELKGQQIGVLRSVDATKASALYLIVVNAIRKQVMQRTPDEMRVQYRPENFDKLSPQEQWKVDLKLGLLDWDGTQK